ncbi:tetratricopeptide repeat protein [Caballeronia temeraria]|uniref:Tetratricopeptide repeat protein n=1 Tax=Caballeronia temeraria TaxID=1777137 RepID=A0A158DXM9_9BURK|nr:glycosyltransferase family 9 protein [Caballeronia temeraria]SAK99389.1 tetratricopeptide repeat protein [Caballeronia temeraria]
MEDTIKTAARRARDPEFAQRFLVGEGIDLAPRDSFFRRSEHLFPRITKVWWWDTSIGAEQSMTGIADASLDFVHAHTCLATQVNPLQSLSRWLDLLKPGGHLIVTMPCEVSHEAQKWRFSIGPSPHTPSSSIDVVELMKKLAHTAQYVRLAPVGAEASNGELIELVLRKRAVQRADERMIAIINAESAQASVAACFAAIEAYPYRYDVHQVAAQELLRWREFAQIDAVLAHAVEHMPDDHRSRLVHALHAISSGRLNEGFALRERLMRPVAWQRRTKAQPPRDIPCWSGEPLAGKRIVIWSEFGLGDEIFFFRFARILREQAGAASVSVVCQTPLVGLFEASGEADAVIDVQAAGEIPPHDYWVYPHAIPVHLPLQFDALPESVPYLRAPQTPAPGMTQLDPRAVKVGIVFRGDPTRENDSTRSMPSISVLDALFGIEGVEFYSLQKGAGAGEAAEYAKRLHNFHDIGAQVTNMAETASAIAALDVVVTTDTSVAHVAGALGKPVWLMLAWYCDWRWHYLREDSPWYPSMRLVRQEYGQDWAGVVGRIGGWLRQWSERRGR